MSLFSIAVANAPRSNGPANRLAHVSDGQSIMEWSQIATRGEPPKPMKPEEVAAALRAAREQYAQLEGARPAMSAGLGALNQHRQYLTAAAERLRQIEAAYEQTFGAKPTDLALRYGVR